jgi:hypothetical protein
MSKCDPSSQCCKKKNQQMGIKLEGSQGQVDIRVDLGELVGIVFMVVFSSFILN